MCSSGNILLECKYIKLVIKVIATFHNAHVSFHNTHVLLYFFIHL